MMAPFKDREKRVESQMKYQKKKRKLLNVSIETAGRLDEFKQEDDSYDKAINNLLDNQEYLNKKSDKNGS